jgi:REP element-mobilizing transposase RayT
MARAKRHYIPGYIWHITHRCHKRIRKYFADQLDIFKIVSNILLFKKLRLTYYFISNILLINIIKLI